MTKTDASTTPPAPSATCEDPLVSVIVPVYNVQAYVRQCLQSVADQTYTNCQVLVVDDGSTDESGAICDEFASRYSHFTVFHTANGGLSAARNYGIDRATGSYLLFVDSDDWIEPNTVETLVRAVLQTNADVVTCRRCLEYVDQIKIQPHGVETMTVLQGADILHAYICEDAISNSAWGKLYNAQLFTSLRYPVGVVYEDLRTTWRVLDKAKRATLLPDLLFHYRIRRTSIVNTYSVSNLKDWWHAHKGLYDIFCLRSPDYERALLVPCMSLAYQLWRKHYSVPRNERASLQPLHEEISQFVRAHYRDALSSRMVGRTKLFLAFTRWPHPASYAAMHCLDQVSHLVWRRQQSTMFE